MSLRLLAGTIYPVRITQDDLENQRVNTRQAILAERFSRCFDEHLKEFGNFIISGEADDFRQVPNAYARSNRALQNCEHVMVEESDKEERDDETTEIRNVRRSYVQIAKTAEEIARLPPLEG